TKDFGFLPIPKRLQYDPEHPHPWTLSLNVVFGLSSTFLVANLYYCQPILIQLSLSFGVSYDRVSRIPTLLQAGYAGGLLFISPLGDLLPRRPLLLLLTFISASLTLGLPLTSSISTFEALSFLIGIATVVPQILMPLAADLAPPHRRASALSIVLAGLLLGVLIARVLAGVVAQFVTWRVVYWVALGLQWAILAMMWASIPDFPRRNNDLTYVGIFWTMARFLVTEPVVVQAVFISMASSATFTNFWVTLTFLLGGPPYNFSTLAIGLFGLIGIAGVCCAPLIGRIIDKLSFYIAVSIATVALILVWAIETGAGGISLAAVIITCFGMDLFRQMQQVSTTNWVFGLEPRARARLNAILIISLFIGQVMGTSAGTAVFLKYGWRPAAALSLGWQGFCMLVLLVRGPKVDRYTWFGW
ncbi:MFS general substrate transporter, partial [Panus rudis PR-1116 ss-1]